MDKQDLAEIRGQLSSETLKRVDIHIDFSGVTFIDPWINLLIDKDFNHIFESWRPGEVCNEITDTVRLQTLADLVGISLERYSKMRLFIFENGHLEGLKSRLKLVVSEAWIELSISCDEYKGLDPYIEFVRRILKSLEEKFRMCRLCRLSIRKLNGFMSRNDEDLFRQIKKERFSSPGVPLDAGYNVEYRDSYNVKELKWAYFTVNRLFRVGYTDSRHDTKAYQAVIDTEVSFDLRGMAESNRHDSEELWKNVGIARDLMFQFLLQNLTKEYIVSKTTAKE